MSYHAFFSFTSGISKTIIVPTGTIGRISNQIENTEITLGIKRTKYLDNPPYWEYNDFSLIKSEVLCKTAQQHNNEIIDFYHVLEKYSQNPLNNGEELTPKIFSDLLPGLAFVNVKPHRWTGEYYTAKMETIYEVMRGRETDGISFDAKSLTEKQASAVIRIFSEFLDTDDRRLEVPKGEDYLASSYNGGYEWCEKCGAVTYDYVNRCNKKKCPIKEKYKDDSCD